MSGKSNKMLNGRMVVRDVEAGLARRIASDRRMDALRQLGLAPEVCGPLPIAPAHRAGGVVVSQRMTMVPRGEKGWEPVPTGYGGRAVLRAADAFDRMAKAAERAKLPEPFSIDQVEIGRRYRALVEKHASRGFKCSTLEAGLGSGSAEGLDAQLAISQEIDTLRRRIGAEYALIVRRVRSPEQAPDDRVSISHRALVDDVCLEGRSFNAVLRRFGWSTKGYHRDALREALSGALDRMIGYRGQI